MHWIDKIKNEDSGFASFLKWCYAIGKISWIHALVSAAAGILIPIFFEKNCYKSMVGAIVIAILDILYAYICNEYQMKLFISRKFTSELLEEFSSLIKSLNIFVQNETEWNWHFEKMRFKQSVEVSKQVYEMMDGGKKVFPNEGVNELRNYIEQIKHSVVFTKDELEAVYDCDGICLMKWIIKMIFSNYCMI